MWIPDRVATNSEQNEDKPVHYISAGRLVMYCGLLGCVSITRQVIISTCRPTSAGCDITTSAPVHSTRSVSGSHILIITRRLRVEVHVYLQASLPRRAPF